MTSNEESIETHELDTAKVLKEMQIVEKQEDLYLMDNDLTPGLKKVLKTIDNRFGNNSFQQIH